MSRRRAAAEEDRRLRARAARYQETGALWLLCGGLAAAAGGAIALIGSGLASWVEALGIMIASVAAAPTVAGIAFMLTAAVAAWSGRRRPFA